MKPVIRFLRRLRGLPPISASNDNRKIKQKSRADSERKTVGLNNLPPEFVEEITGRPVVRSRLHRPY